MNKHFKEALDWESSNRLKDQKSLKLAWTLTKISVAITILMIIAFITLLPLKESIPYVIRVDNATGIPDIVTMLDVQELPYDEVRDKYFLATYVKSRETYDYHTLQKDYDLVNLFSSDPVAKEYQALFEGDNALDVVYDNNVQITIKVISVVPSRNKVATVRFIKTTKRIGGETIETKWVATIGYDYVVTSNLLESSRLINPFGFQALSYRVDPEIGAEQ